MTTIGKAALLEALAARTGATQVDAKAFIDALTAEITEQTAAGHTVRLHGFGAFSQKTNKARVGRHPKTGEAIDIAESKRLTFKASKGA